MKHHPFRLLILVLLFLMSGSMTAGTSTFTLVTLSGPGSQSDTAARYFSHELEKQLGQRVIVVNAPGGDGIVGMRQFMNNGATCDSLLMGNASLLFAAQREKELGFDALKEFVPIHGLANFHSVIAVPASSSIRTLKDLVAYHAKESRLIGGSISPQTSTSIGMLDNSLHVKTDVIHYKTSAQMFGDLVAGRLDYSIVLTGTSAIQGLLESGKLRVIAGAENQRHPAFPEVPTITEQGYKPIEVFYWGAFFANDDTTRVCRRKLEEAIHRTLLSRTGDKFASQVGEPDRLLYSSDDIAALMRQQLKIITSLNAR